MKIAVIYGGKSGEHEISLLSASSVVRNIDSTKHMIILIGIAKNGRWYLQNNSLLQKLQQDSDYVLEIFADEKKEVSVTPGGGMYAFSANGEPFQADIVFPVLHGTFGEDGTIQGLLEMADIPYVGCGVMASSITMDKDITKKLWRQAGLQVVPSVTMTRTDISDSGQYDKVIADAVEKLGFPLFVKPCCAGSSVGATKAGDLRSLSGALLDAFHWDNKVLIEKAVTAHEVECSVIGNSITSPVNDEIQKVRAFIPGEIIPSHEFYDYDAKYTDPNGAALKIPADIPAETEKKLRAVAVKAYETVNASGLSRVDFFVDKNSGEIFLNEINTLPGFTSISMFPKLCNASGIGFTKLIELLLNEAVLRYKAHASLQTSR